MCARFALAATAQEILERFGGQLTLPLQSLGERYNVAPTQLVIAVTEGTDGRRTLRAMKWGLVPGWAKDPTIGRKLLNARGETAAEKPAFRNAFQRRRCIIPASAIYEWRSEGKQQQPFAIRRRGGEMLAMAGLWEEWRQPSGEPLQTCTILTTEANALMSELHDRMPVLLARDEEEAWLSPETAADRLQALLDPFPSDEMEMYPVSTEVNRVASEGPSLLEPIRLG